MEKSKENTSKETNEEPMIKKLKIDLECDKNFTKDSFHQSRKGEEHIAHDPQEKIVIHEHPGGNNNGYNSFSRTTVPDQTVIKIRNVGCPHSIRQSFNPYILSWIYREKFDDPDHLLPEPTLGHSGRSRHSSDSNIKRIVPDSTTLTESLPAPLDIFKHPYLVNRIYSDPTEDPNNLAFALWEEWESELFGPMFQQYCSLCHRALPNTTTDDSESSEDEKSSMLCRWCLRPLPNKTMEDSESSEDERASVSSSQNPIMRPVFQLAVRLIRTFRGEGY